MFFFSISYLSSSYLSLLSTLNIRKCKRHNLQQMLDLFSEVFVVSFLCLKEIVNALTKAFFFRKRYFQFQNGLKFCFFSLEVHVHWIIEVRLIFHFFSLKSEFSHRYKNRSSLGFWSIPKDLEKGLKLRLIRFLPRTLHWKVSLRLLEIFHLSQSHLSCLIQVLFFFS